MKWKLNKTSGPRILPSRLELESSCWAAGCVYAVQIHTNKNCNYLEEQNIFGVMTTVYIPEPLTPNRPRQTTV